MGILAVAAANGLSSSVIVIDVVLKVGSCQWVGAKCRVHECFSRVGSFEDLFGSAFSNFPNFESFL